MDQIEWTAPIETDVRDNVGMSGHPSSVRTVLVVEDDPAIREFLRLHLDLGGAIEAAADWVSP